MEARFRLAYPEFALDVDLQLPEKGITALFGHSGSGKTTVLRCFAGLNRAPEGRLVVDGQVWQDEAQGVFLPTHARPLGLVFQEASLFPHLSVRKNLEYGMKRAGNKRGEGFDACVDLLGIRPLLDRAPERLSGGERQRVAIAALLAQDTPLLLLDEPANALDLAHQVAMTALLARLCREQGRAVVSVGHDLNLAWSGATHALLLHGDGQWRAGPVAQVMRADLLGACLGQPIAVIEHGGRTIFLPDAPAPMTGAVPIRRTQ